MTSNFLPRMSINKQTYYKLSEEIINLLKLKKVDEIEKIINEIHPADIADILEILNEKDNDKLKEIIENKKYAEAIIELDENVKNIFLSKFSADTIANDLINQLESDDAVDIILELKDDKKEKVLSQIKNQSVLKNITNLLKYESNTAGSIFCLASWSLFQPSRVCSSSEKAQCFSTRTETSPPQESPTESASSSSTP